MPADTSAYFKLEQVQRCTIVIPLKPMEQFPDVSLEPALRAIDKELGSQQPASLVIDLGSLEICNSAFISFLLRCDMAAQKRGLEMALASVATAVEDVLTLVGLHSRWTIYPNCDKAAARLGQENDSLNRRLGDLS